MAMDDIGMSLRFHVRSLVVGAMFHEKKSYIVKVSIRTTKLLPLPYFLFVSSQM